MNMKGHILAALREQFDRWEEFLVSLSDNQITAPRFDLGWSIKDVIAHLYGWQQVSSARMEAAVLHREPEFPRWVGQLPGDWEDDANVHQTNAFIYEIHREKPWSEVHHVWKEGFLRMLELSQPIPERELLDGDRYPWLKGYSLAFVLIAAYDHHQEHLEGLMAWQRQQGDSQRSK